MEVYAQYWNGGFRSDVADVLTGAEHDGLPNFIRLGLEMLQINKAKEASR